MDLVEVLSIVPKCEYVIDVDEEYNIVVWNENITKKLKDDIKVDSERSLDSLMKWYLQTITEHNSFKSLECWKVAILKHIKFFRTYLMELNCLYLDNYLSNMENILVQYVELELKLLSNEEEQGPSAKGLSKKRLFQIYGRVTKILYTYLLRREDHVFHVLMKIKYDVTKEAKVFMNLVYRKLLTKDPSNKSDLAFCRAYLLFEKWKKILSFDTDSKDDVQMKLLLYKLYKRTPQSAEENPVLKKILSSNTTTSILDMLAFSQDDNDSLINRYFKFFASGNIQEGEVISDSLDLDNVQLGDEQIQNIDEDDDEEFERAYNCYLRSMSGVKYNIIDTIEIPDEDDADGDCEILEEVVSFHDITDDDDPDVIIISDEPTERQIENQLPQTQEIIHPVPINDDQPVIKCDENVEQSELIQNTQLNEVSTEHSDREPCRSVIKHIQLSKDVLESTNKETYRSPFLNKDVVETSNEIPSESTIPKRQLSKDGGPLVTGETCRSPIQRIQLNKDLAEFIDKETCRSPLQICTDPMPVLENNVARECRIVVTIPSEKIVKKLVTTETQTDFTNQIDGLPTPSGSEDRNNEDPMMFIANTPIVYAPIGRLARIDGDSDNDSSKNDVRSQSPTTSHTDVSNKEYHDEEVFDVTQKTTQRKRIESGGSTNETRTSVEEKCIFETDTEHHEKNMSPDSSEDARSAELRVKHKKVMYKSPHKLRKTSIIPDWASIMGENSSDENPFAGRVEGRLRCGDDKYNGIAENFNLYEPTLPDETICDNGVSSSINVTENEDRGGQNQTCPKDINASSEMSNVVRCGEEISSKKRKKRVTLAKKIQTSDDIRPRSPVEIPNGLVKGILKPVRDTLTEEVTTSDDSSPRSSPVEIPNGVAKDTLKPLRVTLAEEVTTSNDSSPRSSPVEIPNGVMKDIFKPNKVLSVNVQRLSEKTMDEFTKLNESADMFPNFSVLVRTFRDEKNSNGKNFSISTKSMNFNKWRSQHIANDFMEEDSIHFQNCRAEKKDNEFNHREGMVTSNISFQSEHCYENDISKECNHICCCNGLANGLCSLNLTKYPSNGESILNLSSQTDSLIATTTKSHSPVIPDNPFQQSPRTRDKGKKRKSSPEPPNIYDFCSHIADYDVETSDTMSPNINLDLSFVSTIVENFDKESTDFILDLNPVILEKDNNDNMSNFKSHTVSELEEFDQKKFNESAKEVSAIPPDLHNLNLRKFSPSPIINCLSSQSNSPSQTFVQEYNHCPLIEKQEESNIDLKSQAFSDHLKSDCESLYFSSNSNSLKSEKEFQITVEQNLSENHSNVNFESESKSSERMGIDNVVVRVGQKCGDINQISTENEEIETRLPLKKRKLSVVNNKGEEVDEDEDILGPDLVEEIIRRARAEKNDKDDISYPAKPMISIAEIQDLAEKSPRMFKTPAEKKEMPPPPLPTPQAEGSPLNTPQKIVTEQYNNLTYNNPTIYYHMNNVPYPFFPCASLPYFPSFLVPMNSTTTIDMNVVPKQEQFQQQQQNQQTSENHEPSVATTTNRTKKEKKSRGRKRHN